MPQQSNLVAGKTTIFPAGYDPACSYDENLTTIVTSTVLSNIKSTKSMLQEVGLGYPQYTIGTPSHHLSPSAIIDEDHPIHQDNRGHMAKHMVNFNPYAALKPISKVYSPKTLKELSEVVSSTSKVRALGASHSWSVACGIHENVIILEHLNQPIRVDGNRVTVEAGIAISELARWASRRGLTLGTQPDYMGITIGGAISTASHGQGLEYGSLSSLVVGMTFVDSRGNILRLSKGERLTCINSDGTEQALPPEYSAIDADELLSAMRCSLGLGGIIYSLTLELEPTFKAERWIQAYSLEDFVGGFDDIVRFKGVSAHYDPYVNVMKIDLFSRMPDDGQITTTIDEDEDLSYFKTQFYTNSATLYGGWKFRTQHILPASRGVRTSLFPYGPQNEALAALLKANIDMLVPPQLPMLHRYLDTLNTRTRSTGKEFGEIHTLLSDHFWTHTYVDNSLELQMFFPLENATYCIKEIKSFLEKKAWPHVIDNMHIRVVGSDTDVMLAVQRYPGMWVSCHFQGNSPEDRKIKDELGDFMFYQLGGNFHWGKNFRWDDPNIRSMIESRVPHLQRFVDMMMVLDPTQKFSNPWYDAVFFGLSDKVPKRPDPYFVAADFTHPDH